MITANLATVFGCVLFDADDRYTPLSGANVLAMAHRAVAVEWLIRHSHELSGVLSSALTKAARDPN